MQICKECENSIPEARIKALPNVKFCIDCQEERGNSGRFVKSRMLISQEISGWSFESVVQTIIPGDD